MRREIYQAIIKKESLNCSDEMSLANGHESKAHDGVITYVWS